jgi:hypothetical protein
LDSCLSLHQIHENSNLRNIKCSKQKTGGKNPHQDGFFSPVRQLKTALVKTEPMPPDQAGQHRCRQSYRSERPAASANSSADGASA